MDELDALLTTRQLQEILQVDRITIYRMLDDGRLPGFKVGRQWRFRREAIEKWLQEQRSDSEGSGASDSVDDPHHSAEALSLSGFQAVQDIFAEALGVGTVITAVDGRPLTAVSNSCPFCDLILGTPSGRQRCMGSWRATATRSESTPQINTCHAGLCYITGRIVVQGKPVAVTHAGQFLAKPPIDTEWSDRIIDLITTVGLAAGPLQNALARVPVLDLEMQARLVRLWNRIAATFSDLGEDRVGLLERLERIAQISQL
jgi:excisionase family DNA binding protein